MTKATKATLKRLINADTRQGQLLNEIATEAQNVEDLYRDGFTGFEHNAHYVDCDLSGTYIHYIARGDYDKATLRGLCSKYPNLIQGSLTNGLGEVCILDINKLSREINRQPASLDS